MEETRKINNLLLKLKIFLVPKIDFLVWQQMSNESRKYFINDYKKKIAKVEKWIGSMKSVIEIYEREIK